MNEIIEAIVSCNSCAERLTRDRIAAAAFLSMMGNPLTYRPAFWPNWGTHRKLVEGRGDERWRWG